MRYALGRPTYGYPGAAEAGGVEGAALRKKTNSAPVPPDGYPGAAEARGVEGAALRKKTNSAPVPPDGYPGAAEAKSCHSLNGGIV